MSFLDDIIDIGSDIFGAVSNSGVLGGVVRSVGLGYLLKEVQSSTAKENTVPETARPEAATTPDKGVREQVDPDTQHSIPVVYGQAFLGGIVTDAVLTNNNQTMWYCLVICEKTGNLLSGAPSVISIDRIYWDQNEIKFQANGHTVQEFFDGDGNRTDNPSGLIDIYLYNNGSANQCFPAGYNGATVAANSIFPNWTANHTMDELVFALIKVNYNREKGITGLGNIEFKVKNTMGQAGDCINDYLTNTRYGAGITIEEINA